MQQDLFHFLSKFKELTEVQINELGEMMTVKEIKKNTLVVKQGQLCNLCYFVLKGCLRQYILSDGIEKTIAIYTEEEAINFFSNQGNQQPSDSYLTTVEDAVLLIGNPEKDEEIYAKFPILMDITRRMLELDFGKTQSNFAKFITSSPQERYLNLLEERPELLMRVPQIIIASYLGVTPESLSRIRKRIHKNINKVA